LESPVWPAHRRLRAPSRRRRRPGPGPQPGGRAGHQAAGGAAAWQQLLRGGLDLSPALPALRPAPRGRYRAGSGHPSGRERVQYGLCGRARPWCGVEAGDSSYAPPWLLQPLRPADACALRDRGLGGSGPAATVVAAPAVRTAESGAWPPRRRAATDISRLDGPGHRGRQACRPGVLSGRARPATSLPA
jgi:hypothetical protein